jgi:hypothetical protein
MFSIKVIKRKKSTFLNAIFTFNNVEFIIVDIRESEYVIHSFKCKKYLTNYNKDSFEREVNNGVYRVIGYYIGDYLKDFNHINDV